MYKRQGVVLGLVMAYLATESEELKALIRTDIVTMASELAKQRKGVPVHVVINGIPLNKSIDLENVILVPSEMTNGRIVLDLSTDEVTNSGSAGMCEFFPDFSMLVKPITGLIV